MNRKNEKNISRILVVSLALSLSIPSYAAASNVTISIDQEGTSIQEKQDNLQENPLIPKLNIKLFDAMTSYYELIEKYNLANTESDKKAVLDELTVIVTAVHEVIPNLTFNEYENILNGKNPEGATLADLLDFFGEESTQLFYTKGNSRFVNGELDEPELKLDADKVYEYNTKLLYIKTIYTNASKEEKEDIQDTLTLFKSTLTGYENTETVLATLDSILSGVETETPKEEQTSVTSFNDVPSSHWAYKDIMTMVSKGAIAGTTAPVNGVGTYNPNGSVTLGQFLAISTRLVASDKIQAGNYAHWATPNYNAAIESNLIRSSDFESTPASLNANISREDMAYILVNIAKANGETLNITSGIQNKIKDFNSISPERQNVVLQAYSNGLLAGDNYGKFNPHDTATRAQIAAVFCRVMNYVSRPSVSVDTPSTDPSTPVVTGYVITEAGETQGMLRSAYSRQYDLQALQGIRVGSDSKGVYVTFTAPQLPTEISKDFTFQFVSDVYKSNGDYFANNIEVNLKSGETKTVYFVADGEAVSKSQIANMYVSVKIMNSDNKFMMSHRADTDSKSKVLESWYDGSKESVNFDSSAIFSGIGK
ncbi:S-layer homology domain-containing protein [Sinanaerobacter sp. ZZT-01]|uniref:S-layer homology domain-containing protein n=1 Tax=Sinanaerobacter sp. ZZT-01 TaxID=3111540 RepID=UPI002D799ED6|nr:S-layer homology domain-containing protein [Sinanaerobacter sp. ZZT-01]WRR92704.1 S-layer homology domain-containing protein [Sinanaerobacter sp. ZZT-01]